MNLKFLIMKKLKKCKVCNIYTMKQFCPKCNRETLLAYPPNLKFSLLKYSKHRNLVKEKENINNGS